MAVFESALHVFEDQWTTTPIVDAQTFSNFLELSRTFSKFLYSTYLPTYTYLLYLLYFYLLYLLLPT